jgi:hypothetical protein
MATDGENSDSGDITEVELKVSVKGDVDHALGKLGIEEDKAKPRTIWFFEGVDPNGSPKELPLLHRGIIFRVRGKPGDADGESTLKLRGREGCLDPARWRHRIEELGVDPEDAKIEGDWAAKRRQVAASLDHKFEIGFDELVAKQPGQLERLRSRPQADLADQLLVELDELIALGPISARKWEAKHVKLDDRLEVEAEAWEIDAGLRFLELSTRVPIAKGPDTLQWLRGVVEGAGLSIDDDESKTQTALEHFAGL